MKLTTDILEQMILEELEEGFGDYLKKAGRYVADTTPRQMSKDYTEYATEKGEDIAKAIKAPYKFLQKQVVSPAIDATVQAVHHATRSDEPLEHPMQKRNPKPFKQTRLVPKNKL